VAALHTLRTDPESKHRIDAFGVMPAKLSGPVEIVVKFVDELDVVAKARTE
jgi:hypothetical protein